MTQTYTNLDEASGLFFERELEHRKSQTYDVVRAPLRAFTLIPVDNSAGPGAESIKYEQYDSTGLAKIIANYADDLPSADVKGKEFVALVKGIGNHFSYSVQEIRAAQLAGKSLEQRKANSAARAQRELWNRIAFFGDEEHNLQGWLTNPNIPADAVEDDGEGGATTFESKDPTQIVRDMNDLANGIVDRTNGAEEPDTLVMPIKQYTKISSTRMDSGTDTTILQFFLTNNPFINEVMWANELKGAGEGGSDIMIAYERSADKFTLEMPQMFEMFPVQEINLTYKTPCHSRIAGVIVYYPFSQAIGEGI